MGSVTELIRKGKSNSSIGVAKEPARGNGEPKVSRVQIPKDPKKEDQAAVDFW